MESPKKLQEEAGLHRTALEQIPVMVYELGDLAKSLAYVQVRPDLAQAYMAEAGLALADLICQCYIMSEHFESEPVYYTRHTVKSNFHKLLELGLERQKERMAEVKEWLGDTSTDTDARGFGQDMKVGLDDSVPGK